MVKCSKPSAGIWWYSEDKILFAAPVEVKKGLSFGDCISGLTDQIPKTLA